MSAMAWWSSRRQRRSATLTEVFAKVRGLTSLDSPEGDQEGVNPGEINAVEQNVDAVEVVNLERLRDEIQALAAAQLLGGRQAGILAEVASGTTLLPGVRSAEWQSCRVFEHVKLA
ncbi:hypothetical protein J6590_054098, partial [Homalodisca vitripennis]